MTEIGDKFQTRDLFLVAFLLLHDIRPSDTWQSGRVVYGLYERTEPLENLVELWKDPGTQVPASKFAGTYREAKRILLGPPPGHE
jgi:hypothetical protein